MEESRFSSKNPAGRIPPQDLNAEKSLLGAILLSDTNFPDLLEIVKHKDFYDERHGKIFHAMTTLYQHHSPIDLLTLTAELRRAKELRSVGGAAYLTELTNFVPTATHSEAYAQIVANAAIRRRNDSNQLIVRNGDRFKKHVLAVVIGEHVAVVCGEGFGEKGPAFGPVAVEVPDAGRIVPDDEPPDAGLQRSARGLGGGGMEAVERLVGHFLRIGRFMVKRMHAAHVERKGGERAGVGAVGVGFRLVLRVLCAMPLRHDLVEAVAAAGYLMFQGECRDGDMPGAVHHSGSVPVEGMEGQFIPLPGSEMADAEVEVVPEVGRTVDVEPPRPAVHRHRVQQPGKAEDVIAVGVGDEDGLHLEE